MTAGRCFPCRTAYRWPEGKGLLRDARCPSCGHPLRQTTYLLKSVPWKDLETAPTRRTGP